MSLWNTHAQLNGGPARRVVKKQLTPVPRSQLEQPAGPCPLLSVFAPPQRPSIAHFIALSFSLGVEAAGREEGVEPEKLVGAVAGAVLVPPEVALGVRGYPRSAASARRGAEGRLEEKLELAELPAELLKLERGLVLLARRGPPILAACTRRAAACPQLVDLSAETRHLGRVRRCHRRKPGLGRRIASAANTSITATAAATMRARLLLVLVLGLGEEAAGLGRVGPAQRQLLLQRRHLPGDRRLSRAPALLGARCGLTQVSGLALRPLELRVEPVARRQQLAHLMKGREEEEEEGGGGGGGLAARDASR